MKVELPAELAGRRHRAETHTIGAFMARVYNFYCYRTRDSQRPTGRDQFNLPIYMLYPTHGVGNCVYLRSACVGQP